jgi:adenosylcobalamin-dependent ribonucleoside-triphosphate reductase
MPNQWLRLPAVNLAGVLRGLYSANGSVVDKRVTLKSSCLALVEQVQQALSSLGISSYYTVNKPASVRFTNGEYTCKQSYDLNIATTAGRTAFASVIGFIQPYKTDKLRKTLPTTDTNTVFRSKLSYEVVDVEYLGEHDVYDITVAADEHAYWTGGLLVSNCLEQTLHNKELCCLVETFPSRHESYDDFEKTLKFAYLYAKTVTLVPTHDNATNQVILKNRRIGTSMSGITQAIERHGRRQFMQWCDRGYSYIRSLDTQYSDWLCVRESIKVTSVKPSGSVSLLPGVTPGIHHPHSEYHIRRIRFQKGHPLAEAIERAGVPVEDDAYSPNTVVAAFPVQEQYFSKSKNQVSVWEQLELAAQMQHYWADNQVSVTVTFSPEEATDIKACLEYYETRLKGVSFLPRKDHGYVQAPYEEITKEQYEAMVASIDQTAIFGAEVTHDQTDKFCDGEVCLVK